MLTDDIPGYLLGEQTRTLASASAISSRCSLHPVTTVSARWIDAYFVFTPQENLYGRRKARVVWA